MRRLGHSVTVLAVMGSLVAMAIAANAAFASASAHATRTTPSAICDSGGGTASTPLVSGCISSEGGTLTTCAVGDPKPSDNTCATLIFPPGPGGFATLTEQTAGLLVCQVPLTPCMGSDVRVTLPSGYGRSNPVRLLLYYDETTVPVGPATAWMEKAGVDAPVAPCVVGPVLVFPCTFSSGRISGQDYRFGIALTSQDPKFQGLRG